MSYAPAVGVIKRYRDPSVYPSPRRAAALGYRHAGCLQFSHADPPADGPPRVELRSAGTYRLAAPGAITCSLIHY